LQFLPCFVTGLQLLSVPGSKMEGLLHGGGTVSEHLTICRSGDSLSGEQGDTEQSCAYSVAIKLHFVLR
jgi:hypothetical protein